MIEGILLISTILGGIAALLYFWDKIKAVQLFELFHHRSVPAIPIDRRSVFAYANGNEGLLALTQKIAKRRRFEISDIDSESIWLHEQIEKLGIKDIRELDSYVKKYGDKAVQLSDYIKPSGGSIDSGFVLGRVFHIVAIEQGGKEGLRKFLLSLNYSNGGKEFADEMYESYTQVKMQK